MLDRAQASVTSEGGTGLASDDLDQTIEASSSTPSSPARPEHIARFVVLERLGAGGMGVVYAAWDPKLDRRVALKLVRGQAVSDTADERLLREAQAMARLNHPNVVSVYDVGTHAGAVWIAMEFVEGPTLQRWKVGLERTWEQTLALYRQAGAGLAAAHAAGLVHRDFKPENVLIGSEGRARVADFGLVRPVEASASQSREMLVTSSGVSKALELSTGEQPVLVDNETLEMGNDTPGLLGSSKLTMDGALLGTPRYMAPEQFARQPVDERSDQFSFCIALYRDLYGHAPFVGERIFELAAAVTLGDPRPPPRDTPVPASIGRAIMRGLSNKPDDRFPDMRSLLDALEVEPAKRRWPWALGAMAVAASSAALALWLGAGTSEEVDVCADGREQMSALWGPSERQQLSQHFASLEIGYGASSLAAIDEGLSAWTLEWSEVYTQACEHRHEQSAELYDLRMACLASRREEVEGLVELLADADVALVREAPALVEQLPDFDACTRVAELRAVDLPALAVRADVHSWRERLARVGARIGAGRVEGVSEELDVLREQSAAIGYEPLEVELDMAEASLRAINHDYERVRDLLLRAHQRALGLGYDRAALDAAHQLIRLDYAEVRDADIDLAKRWFGVAAGLGQRLGSNLSDEVQRHYAYGRALSQQMRYPEAQVQHQRAVELLERLGDHDSLEAARVHLAAAVAYGDDAKWAESIYHLGRAVEIYEARLDAHHPLLLDPLRVRVRQRLNAGALDSALADAERMLAISADAYGEAHPAALDALSRVALVDDLRGDHEAGIAKLERILELSGESEQLRTGQGVHVSNSLCFGLYKLGRTAEARAVCERALAAAEAVLGPEHTAVAVILNNFGLIERADGDIEASLAHDRRALEISEASVGPEHPYTAYALVGIGEALLARGDQREAAQVLERARGIRATTTDPGEIGEVECLLGQALSSTKGESERAHELGRVGLERLRGAGPNWTAQVEACEAWLEKAPARG